MEKIIAEHGDEIRHIINTSKNLRVASARIQKQFEIGYIKAQQIIYHMNFTHLHVHSRYSLLDGMAREDSRLVHLIPERTDLGIGGCWNLAVDDERCGRFAVQLDSDDLYSSPHTLQRMVDAFYEQKVAMVVGAYRTCDFHLQTLPPGLIDHREWTPGNGCNNALRVNGLGAPRAFFTPLVRQIHFPNTS